MGDWFKKNKIVIIIVCVLVISSSLFLWGYSTGRKVGLVEMANEVDTLRGELSAVKAGISGQAETIRTLQTSVSERDGLIEERDRIIAEREGFIKERQDITNNLTTGERRNLELLEYGESLSEQIGDDIQQYLDRE